VYAASVVAPCTVAVYRAFRDREPLWLYHPVMTLVFAWITVGEALRNLPDAIDLLIRGRNRLDSSQTSKE
jgi:hypothetical protein